MGNKTCVIIPTYNNAETLESVIKGVSQYVKHIIVVDDGSTDNTAERLKHCPVEIDVVSHRANRGKGCALLSGFKRAKEQGFTHAITIDSDGQHDPADLPKFLEAIMYHSYSIIVGNRFDPSLFTGENVQNMNGQSKFANKFSNFWFRMQTGIKLADTQTGYRAYPLNRLKGLKWITSRYEAELELLVYAAWNGVSIEQIPVKVFYPSAEERVSHFRPVADFARISLLNTFLTFGSIVYAWPRKLILSVLTIAILLLLFLLMIPLQIFILIFFNSHKVSEKECLAYHKGIQNVSRWLISHIPGVTFSIDNPDRFTFEEPAVIISNHQSYLDLLCIMALSPRLVILTKMWVWNNPLYYFAIRYADFLPVTNNFEYNYEKLEAIVKRGYSVVLFPEGTRSSSCKLLRFHQGAFLLAKRMNLKIVPVLLHGTGLVLNKKTSYISSGSILAKVGAPVSIHTPEMAEKSAMTIAKEFRKKYIQDYEEMCCNR